MSPDAARAQLNGLFTAPREICDIIAVRGPPLQGKKKAAPQGAAEVREDTSKKDSKRVTALLQCTI
jgi:hypothetical protein